MPENLRSRFRLERLRRDAALEAVINPLKGSRRRFAPGVAERLLDSLMTIHVRPKRDVSRPHSDNEDADLLAGGGGLSSSLELPVFTPPEGFEVKSEFVEPVQLQVVSQNLWSNLGNRRRSRSRLRTCCNVAMLIRLCRGFTRRASTNGRAGQTA